MSAYEICKCGRHENASAHTHTGHSDYYAFEPKKEEPIEDPRCGKCGHKKSDLIHPENRNAEQERVLGESVLGMRSHPFEPMSPEATYSGIKPLCPKCGSANLNDCGMGGKTCLDCQWVQGVGDNEELEPCRKCGNPDGYGSFVRDGDDPQYCCSKCGEPENRAPEIKESCPTCGKVYDARDYYNPDGSSRCVPRCWPCSLKVELKTPEHLALEASYEMGVKENKELMSQLDNLRADFEKFEKLEANWDELKRDLDRGKFDTVLEVAEAMDLMRNRK